MLLTVPAPLMATPPALPEINALSARNGPLVTVPAPASEIPIPPAERILPELVMVQTAAAVPSMPSTPVPEEITAPFLVMTSGLS